MLTEVILGLYQGYTGIMENMLETTIQGLGSMLKRRHATSSRLARVSARAPGRLLPSERTSFELMPLTASASKPVISIEVL